MLESVGRLPDRAWFAYPAALAVQVRALWGVWDDDLSTGDSAGYWQWADLWFDDQKVNIAWSPVYAALLGTLRALTGDDATVAMPVHRALIALAAVALVLALARRLLPAPIALLVACWWAVLPIVFDTVFEVHLFSALPLLGVALLLSDEPGPWRRGWALALIVAGAILVRNETALIAAILAAALALAAWRAWRAGSGPSPRRLAVATGVPLAVALLLAGAVHERSIFQWERARDVWQAKQTLNVCQVFGTNYGQRHPGYDGDPFLDCERLTQRLFGKPRPTLADAWRANPGEMAAFTAWNLHLLPAGLQLALFNGVTGSDNPDYPPAKLERWWATALSALLLALIAAGGARLWRDRARWAETLARQRWAWLALGATAAVTLAVVVLDARPRPSYMFALTAAIMAAAGLALAVLMRGRPAVERALSLAAVAVPVALVAALPPHYRADDARPLAQQYERLRPLVADAGPATLVVPQPGAEPCAYLVPIGSCRVISYREELAGAGAALGRRLRAAGATALYADAEMLADPAVAAIAAGRGWRLAAAGGTGAERWAVLVPHGDPPSRRQMSDRAVLDRKIAHREVLAVGGPGRRACEASRMRLAKYLAHAGVASRRAAERMVAAGRVTVAGEVVTDPARDVDERSGVAVDGVAVAPEAHETHAVNKPAGVVSTARDTHGRPTVVELVGSDRRLYPVGRLDADTTGLILLTNDGALAERLTHPRYGVEKVYRAEIAPARPSPRALRSLREGVALEDGPTAPARVRLLAPGLLEVTIREGRNRQVRRMVEAVGHRVVALERVAFGPLRLDRLAPGMSRRLSLAEVERLRQTAGGQAPGRRRSRSG